MKHYRLLLTLLAFVGVNLTGNAQTWTGSDPSADTYFLYNVGTSKFINVGDKSAGWGTNAYLTADYGLDIQLEYVGDGVYNLNTQISNGGSNNYLNTALWCDQGATPWTFTKVDGASVNAYTISNDGKYIVANAAGTDVECKEDGTGANAQWLLIGSSDILANLQANTATEVKRTVATFFIKDPDFGRNDMRRPNWVFTNEGGNVTVPGAGVSQGNNPNYGCEFWNNTFDIHQDLTGLPNGIYEFEIYGYGTNGTTYIYATTADGTTEKVFKNQTSAANFQTALNNIDNYPGNATGLVQVTDGTLTIGVKRETNSAADWTVIDQARLYYYGDYTFAECYGADLKDYIAEAEELIANGVYPTTELENAVSNAQSTMSSGTTEEEFAEATASLKDAIATYKAQNEAFIALHQRYTTVREAVLAVSSDVDTSEADDLNDAATTEEDIEDAVAKLRLALINELPNIYVADGDSIDLTNALIDNPTVSVNTDYWTKEGTPNGSYSWAVVNYGETEFYQQNFKFFQNVVLGKGTYSFGVTGFHRAGNHSTYFYAGDDKVLIPGVESSVVNSMAQAKEYFDEGNGQLYLKFALENDENNIEVGIENNDTQTDKWTIFRNFTLRYFGSKVDLSIYEDAWAEAVAAAEAALVDDANGNVVGEELDAVLAAKDDAPEETKASYIEKTDALNNAVQAFKNAAAAYDAYVAEKAVAEMIGSNVAAEPTTAEEALAAVQEMKEDEYNYVDSQYSYDKSEYVGDFPEWTSSATVNDEEATSGTNENEHWSGSPKTYYEQAGAAWGSSAWTLSYEKKAILPAGNFVLKVAARASAAVSGKVSCSETSNTALLPHKGAATKGIDTTGAANFGEGDFANDGKGYGWEWVFLPFTVSEEKEVTITLSAGANSQYQWMSLCDVSLLCKEDVATGITTVASENASAANDIFNLQGQKVGKAQKGVFIQNGKKIVVK